MAAGRSISSARVWAISRRPPPLSTIRVNRSWIAAERSSRTAWAFKIEPRTALMTSSNEASGGSSISGNASRSAASTITGGIASM